MGPGIAILRWVDWECQRIEPDDAADREGCTARESPLLTIEWIGACRLARVAKIAAVARKAGLIRPRRIAGPQRWNQT